MSYNCFCRLYRLFNTTLAAVAEWYRYRIVACLVTSSSPVPLKTHRVGQRCTLNLSRGETSSRWCASTETTHKRAPRPSYYHQRYYGLLAHTTNASCSLRKAQGYSSWYLSFAQFEDLRSPSPKSSYMELYQMSTQAMARKSDEMKKMARPVSPTSTQDPIETKNNFSDLEQDVEHPLPTVKNINSEEITPPLPTKLPHPVMPKIKDNFREQIKLITEKFPKIHNRTVDSIISDRKSKEEQARLTAESQLEFERVNLEKVKLEIELGKINLERATLESQRDSNELQRTNPETKQTSIENFILSVRTLTLPIPKKQEGWNLFFSSLERSFKTKNVPDEFKGEILLNLLGEKAENILVYVKDEEISDYNKLKSLVLREFEPTPLICLQNFQKAKRMPNEAHVQLASRLLTNWDQYCNLRNVNDFNSLKELIVSDKLYETLDNETAVHINIKQEQNWFKPIEMGKEYSYNDEFGKITLSSAFGENVEAKLIKTAIALDNNFLNHPMDCLVAITDKLNADALIPPALYESLCSINDKNNKKENEIFVESADSSIAFSNDENEAECGKDIFYVESDSDNINFNSDYTKMKDEQNTCDSLKTVREELKLYKGNFLLIDGLIYHRDKILNEPVMQLVLPRCRIDKVMKLAHESVFGDHMGVKKTKERIKYNFFWPNMSGEIAEFVQTCKGCQLRKPEKIGDRAPITPIVRPELPFEIVNIDVIGPIQPPSGRGHKYVLCMMDQHTRWPEAVPLRSLTAKNACDSITNIFEDWNSEYNCQ
ncbi:transposon Ty3-I Gag-Pol polyprotein [Trichonephila clavipes]|nr:transposon Ty3-I Gag-Pol polyprotein [Trichonephila clavipes]